MVKRQQVKIIMVQFLWTLVWLTEAPQAIATGMCQLRWFPLDYPIAPLCERKVTSATIEYCIKITLHGLRQSFKV